MRILDNISLWFRVRLFTIKHFFYDVVHYYIRNPLFALQDISLLVMYFFQSPYRIGRIFQKESGDEGAYPYGETPHRTLDLIFSHIPKEGKTCIYDFGSGRGRSCFWLAQFCNCAVVGIEYNPIFVRRANYVKHFFRMKNVEFRCENFLNSSISAATSIYICGTAFSEGTFTALAQKIAKSPKNPYVITISATLDDYLPNTFDILDSFDVRFPWGVTTCYVQKIHNRS